MGLPLVATVRKERTVMIINHNIPAVITNNALRRANTRANQASRRLSTGYRINEAKDDAAGLAIANKMNAQIRSLSMAKRNVEDATSLFATAEGGLSEVTSMVQRLRELAIEGANGIYTTSDREKIQSEADQLIKEIDALSTKTSFNAQTLLDGNKTFTFQVGQNAGLNLDFKFDSVSAMSLGYTASKGQSDHLTYKAVYDDSSENGVGYSEEVSVRSLASLSTEYPDYYGKGLTELCENLEYDMENFDAFAAEYADLIVSGTSPTSSDALASFSKVKKIYERMEETSSKISTVANEVDYGTSSSRESAVDISSNINAVTASTSAFMSSMTNRLNTLKESSSDRLNEQTQQDLSALKSSVKDDLIPASTNYFDSIGTGEGAFSSQLGCEIAIEMCDKALSAVDKVRALAGAAINRLESTLTSLQGSDVNLQDALSRIRDSDMASEMSEYTKYNVIIQAGISVLSQANHRPEQLLSLIQ